MPKKKKVKAKKDHKTSTSSEQINEAGHAIIFSIGIVILAILCTYVMQKDDGATLSSNDLLMMVRRSSSFDLAKNSDSRMLIATDDIPSGTILMEISRDMMVWDLDAARNDFIQKELFSALKGDELDLMNRRAILLASYLALLQKGAIFTNKLHASVAKTLPTYEDYSSFHPVLTDLDKVKKYLGRSSSAYLHVVHRRESLNEEYNLLSSSAKFVEFVSREVYMSCRIAVNSRAFAIKNMPTSELTEKEREYYKGAIDIDFNSVASIEPVVEFMNSHINNNVRVGGYDAKKRYLYFCVIFLNEIS